eukprot:TRINITY_DN3963_c4_g1_i1.p1 TRINITY_DN3963_c4_g1~~TRINITY_DN3963_c4_g1_i1.p1  ORF type:complete len:779 (+),score=193.73 TRINITY_DN3963_c4_g1_i1:60-2396(+)
MDIKVTWVYPSTAVTGKRPRVNFTWKKSEETEELAHPPNKFVKGKMNNPFPRIRMPIESGYVKASLHDHISQQEVPCIEGNVSPVLKGVVEFVDLKYLESSYDSKTKRYTPWNLRFLLCDSRGNPLDAAFTSSPPFEVVSHPRYITQLQPPNIDIIVPNWVLTNQKSQVALIGYFPRVPNTKLMLDDQEIAFEYKGETTLLTSVYSIEAKMSQIACVTPQQSSNAMDISFVDGMNQSAVSSPLGTPTPDGFFEVDDFPEIHTACMSMELGELQQFILDGAIDVEVRDHHGDTALHWAARFGMSGKCQLLIRHMTNIDIVNHLGQTALHLASNAATYLVLIGSGSYINSQDIYGNTPLDVAESDRDVLIEFGAHHGPSAFKSSSLSINDLGMDTLVLTLSFLGLSDINKCWRVSKKWREWMARNSLKIWGFQYELMAHEFASEDDWDSPRITGSTLHNQQLQTADPATLIKIALLPENGELLKVVALTQPLWCSDVNFTKMLDNSWTISNTDQCRNLAEIWMEFHFHRLGANCIRLLKCLSKSRLDFPGFPDFNLRMSRRIYPAVLDTVPAVDLRQVPAEILAQQFDRVCSHALSLLEMTDMLLTFNSSGKKIQFLNKEAMGFMDVIGDWCARSIVQVESVSHAQEMHHVMCQLAKNSKQLGNRVGSCMIYAGLQSVSVMRLGLEGRDFTEISDCLTNDVSIVAQSIREASKDLMTDGWVNVIKLRQMYTALNDFKLNFNLKIQLENGELALLRSLRDESENSNGEIYNLSVALVPRTR